MNRAEISFMSACELVDKLRRQELSSQEITEIILERIEKINPIINAYCTPTLDVAREMAKKADESIKKGEILGRLHGIPTSIKDANDTKGIRTTFGSKMFENFVPVHDEAVVERLKKEGCVILGKTNTPEYALKWTTDNLIFGATKNPWNLERTPGGSSGGAAAAVASGLGSLALGSDAAGSIRIPSCFCGIFGFKPTFGRIPHGLMNLAGTFGTFIHYGPIVRYVQDAALMLDVMVGHDSSDRCSLPKPNLSYLEELKNKPKKIKIGYSLDLGYVKAVEPEIEKTVLDAIQKFEEFDWSAERGRIRIKQVESVMSIYLTTWIAYMLKPSFKQWQNKLDPLIGEYIKMGLNYSAQDIKMADLQREMIYDTVCKFFKKYDVLITPTSACPAFELGKEYPEKIEGKLMSLFSWTYTPPFNITGHPAASIPCGWTKQGLPIGLQIVGRRLDDITVLQLAKAFQDIAPWQEKIPSMAQ